MTRKGWWTAAFLGVTATAVTMELVAANDSSADTIPWTTYIVTWIPEPVTVALIAALFLWLPSHFASRYLEKKGATMSHVAPEPGPDAPSEPLLSMTLVTTVAAAIVGCVVAFGIHLSETQQGTILVLVGALAPVIVGVLGRRLVFSPRTVRRMLATARADAGPIPPDDVMPGL